MEEAPTVDEEEKEQNVSEDKLEEKNEVESQVQEENVRQDSSPKADEDPHPEHEDPSPEAVASPMKKRSKMEEPPLPSLDLGMDQNDIGL